MTRGMPRRASWAGSAWRPLEGQAEDFTLSRPEMGQDVSAQRANDLAAGATCLDHAGRLEPVKVERDKWLREVDVTGQLVYRRRPFSQALHQAQTRRIRQSLVVR